MTQRLQDMSCLFLSFFKHFKKHQTIATQCFEVSSLERPGVPCEPRWGDWALWKIETVKDSLVFMGQKYRVPPKKTGLVKGKINDQKLWSCLGGHLFDPWPFVFMVHESMNSVVFQFVLFSTNSSLIYITQSVLQRAFSHFLVAIRGR